MQIPDNLLALLLLDGEADANLWSSSRKSKANIRAEEPDEAVGFGEDGVHAITHVPERLKRRNLLPRDDEDYRGCAARQERLDRLPCPALYVFEGHTAYKKVADDRDDTEGDRLRHGRRGKRAYGAEHRGLLDERIEKHGYRQGKRDRARPPDAAAQGIERDQDDEDAEDDPIERDARKEPRYGMQIHTASV